MRARGLIAAAIVGVSAALFALAWPWPPPASAPAPVADEDRLALYEDGLDGEWESWTGQSFPDAERPEIGPVELLPVEERDAAFGRCLEEAGFAVRIYSQGMEFANPVGVDQQTAATDQFVCGARFPYPDALASIMSVEQRSALYDYYAGFLTSCLALSGVQVESVPPSRDEFIERSVMWPSWTPYLDAWSRPVVEDEYAYLERLCPSEPSWRRPESLSIGAGG